MQLARLLFRQLDELAQVARRHSRVDAERHGAAGDLDHRTETLDRIEGQFVDGRIGAKRGGGEQQGVAIRGGLGDIVGADVAAGAGAVVGHHRLLPALAQTRAEDARQDVGTGAGGVGHHQRDRTGRPVIGCAILGPVLCPIL